MNEWINISLFQTLPSAIYKPSLVVPWQKQFNMWFFQVLIWLNLRASSDLGAKKHLGRTTCGKELHDSYTGIQLSIYETWTDLTINCFHCYITFFKGKKSSKFYKTMIKMLGWPNSSFGFFHYICGKTQKKFLANPI